MSVVNCSSAFYTFFSGHFDSMVVDSEISELMAVKAKYSAGGEYMPDWHPHVRTTVNIFNRRH